MPSRRFDGRTDLKYGVGLNHMPSGRRRQRRLAAVQVMAHNLARWTARIGLGEQIATTKTLRRRFFSLAGRYPLGRPHPVSPSYLDDLGGRTCEKLAS